MKPNHGQSAVSNRRSASSERKSLGTVHEQRFYAARYVPNKRLTFPFRQRPFNALIHVTVPYSDNVLRDIGLCLLHHGMAAAVCHGAEAERMAEVLDDLVDEHDFSHEGRTVFASVHDDEPLDEVIDYFILPNDLAETGLFLVLGEEESFSDIIKSFARVTGDSRERIPAHAL